MSKTLDSIITKAKIAVAGSALVAAIGCGTSPSGPTDPPPPSGPSEITLKVYNATRGYQGDVKLQTKNGNVNLTGTEIATLLGKPESALYTKEFSIRDESTSSGLGNRRLLVTTGTGSLAADKPTFEAYFPNSENNAPYNCHANPQLEFGRNVIVGELSEPGHTGPMRVWTDSIDNIHQAISSRKYGSLSFQSNASNPHMTVGFGPNHGGVAWLLNWKNAYMLSQQDPFKIDYNQPIVKDSALAEVWETLFGSARRGADDLCGKSSRETLGSYLVTNNAQTGLSPVGIDMTTRGYTLSQ